MQLQEITTKIDNIITLTDNGEYSQAEKSVNELISSYKSHRTQQKVTYESLEYILHSLDIDITEKQQLKIRNVRSDYSEANISRFAFIQMVSTFLQDPEIVASKNIEDTGSHLKNAESLLKKSLSESKTIVEGVSLPPTLIVKSLSVGENPAPYQDLLEVSWSVTNIGDEPIDNARLEISTGQEPLCEIELGKISPNENIERASAVVPPEAGVRNLSVLLESPFTDDVFVEDTYAADSVEVDIYGKGDYCESGLVDLEYLYDRIEGASFIGEDASTRMLSELTAAIESCESAKETAETESTSISTTEAARASTVNSQLNTSLSSSRVFREDYSIYYDQKEDKVPETFHRAILSRIESASENLTTGIEAGLRGSGETGLADAEPEPQCNYYTVSGHRDVDKTIFSSEEASSVKIHIAEIHGIDEIRVIEEYPENWEIIDGDYKRKAEGSLDFGTVTDEETPIELSYSIQAPIHTEESGIYKLGPAHTADSSVEIADSKRVLVIATET